MVSSRGHRHDREREKKAKRRKQEPEITEDTVVSLSPQGRAMYEQFLAMAGEIAGRPITGEELLSVMRNVKAELGTQDPDFRKPENIECFKRHLRAIGGHSD